MGMGRCIGRMGVTIKENGGMGYSMEKGLCTFREMG